jgi:hypothetical protein
MVLVGWSRARSYSRVAAGECDASTVLVDADCKHHGTSASREATASAMLAPQLDVVRRADGASSNSVRYLIHLSCRPEDFEHRPRNLAPVLQLGT